MFAENISYVTLHDMDTGLRDKKLCPIKVSDENIRICSGSKIHQTKREHR